MLLASATLPSTATMSRDWNFRAVFTNAPAGRACSAMLCGSVTVTSELTGNPWLLRAAVATSSSDWPAADITAAATAPSTKGASTSRTWPFGPPLEHMPHGQHRAAEVGQHTTPWPRSARAIASRTESLLVPRVPPGAPPAGSTCTSLPATWEVSSASPRASSDAVGHQYNPDQSSRSSDDGIAPAFAAPWRLA